MFSKYLTAKEAGVSAQDILPQHRNIECRNRVSSCRADTTFSGEAFGWLSYLLYLMLFTRTNVIEA